MIRWRGRIVVRARTRLFEGDELSNFLFTTRFDDFEDPDVYFKSMKTEGIEYLNGVFEYTRIILKIPFSLYSQLKHFNGKY